MDLRLHAYEPTSRAYGPGRRAVAWTQGCSMRCPGCFNPATHDPKGGGTVDTADLALQILTQDEPIDGVTISRGEPFQQPQALGDLLGRLESGNLSRLVFSGYTLDELRQFPAGPGILRHVDVLIAGRYQPQNHQAANLLGSSNQTVHLLTDRHTMHEFQQTPNMEVIIHADGTITMSGIRSHRVIERRLGTQQ